ncbi:MAG: MmgE/PrpD family protein, partial [Alphaproteobacteria bacterium]
MSDDALPDISKSEEFAAWATGLEAGDIPDSVRAAAGNALLDFTGLCIAARGEDYVHATLAAGSEPGGCTALGHAAGVDAAGAALVNGTAAHGEDYDDTF